MKENIAQRERVHRKLSHISFQKAQLPHLAHTYTGCKMFILFGPLLKM